MLQYHIKKKDIGKFVSFKCIPVRNDGISGEPGVFIGNDRVTPGAHPSFPGAISKQEIALYVKQETDWVNKVGSFMNG